MWVTIQNIFLDKHFLGSQSQIFYKFEFLKILQIRYDFDGEHEVLTNRLK